MTQTAFRSQLLTFNGDPAQSSQAANYETDGLLIVADGKVVAAGPYAQLAATLARDAVVHDLRDKLIVPGFIDTEKQVAVTAGALSILYGHEIGRKLQGYLDDPIPTWMENDANCAAMAEKLSGNAVKLDDFALITIDSGVGGALFLDGRIRRGKDWRAGELGMMIPNYETGGFHTMQDYLSTIVLAEEYAKEFDVPTGSIVPATLFHRLDEPRVRKIVDRWIDYLAIGIFNIVAVADPECVLLGGGICREQQLLPLVNAALDKIPQWSDFHTVVKRCRHTNNAGLIGAYYAFETEVEGMEKVPIR